MTGCLRLFSIGLLVVSAAGIGSFFLYPVVLGVLGLLRRSRRAGRAAGDPALPSVSVVMAVRNAAALLDRKIENLLALDYPPELLDFVCVSDGSDDGTDPLLRAYEDRGLRVLSLTAHAGKTEALNRGVGAAAGDLVVFTDADGTCEPDALRRMVRHFADPAVGGVCARRVIGGDDASFKEAQSSYIAFDSLIKKAESRLGYLTSNDGKLYAIRRRLFRPIPPAVTDDLFVSLGVIQQGYRFVFEPGARVFVRVPSRRALHELDRRRRIVSTSLRGIFLMKEILNPFRYGPVALGLLINKVNRRLLPVYLLTLFAGSVLLAFSHPVGVVLAGLQVAFYAAALACPLFPGAWQIPGIHRLSSTAYYFVLGNYGTLMGVLDFLAGRRIVKWEPVKSG
jgi:cellulose synthase/poly-beta-1,6-N-acetylglucosamine synthase-like glycosyltransferase